LHHAANRVNAQTLDESLEHLNIKVPLAHSAIRRIDSAGSQPGL
jgi:hypothetical protein